MRLRRLRSRGWRWDRRRGRKKHKQDGQDGQDKIIGYRLDEVAVYGMTEFVCDATRGGIIGPRSDE